MMRGTRIGRALRLLRDLEICRRRGDRYQARMVDLALDELDLEGGYQRHVRAQDNRIYQWGERQGRRRLT